MNGRLIGTVVGFSEAKGYGFIRPDENGEDVFVHYSGIAGRGRRNLVVGDRVEYSTVLVRGKSKPQATDVEIIVIADNAIKIQDCQINGQIRDDIIFEPDRKTQLRVIQNILDKLLREGSPQVDIYIVQVKADDN